MPNFLEKMAISSSYCSFLANFYKRRLFWENDGMRLIEVIPISKGISYEVLSYFSAEDIPLGSMVEVELRKRKIKGLVVSSRDATEAKGEIRAADFTLKKIEKVEFNFFLSPAFIRTAQKTANYFAGTTGAVLNSLIPKTILNDEELMKRAAPETKGATIPSSTKSETHIIQDSDPDRFASYRKLVREAFARGKSIFILVPTHQSALNLKSQLEKGIENHTFLLSGSLSKKKLGEFLQKIETDNHSKLLIGTAQYLFLTTPKIGTLIVEEESSGAYRSLSRPFIDFRYFAENLAHESGFELILADQFLRIETLNRYDEKEVVEKSPLRFRIEDAAPLEIIDMRKYRKSSGASFQVLSEELISQIKEMIKREERMFIFTARRGLSPTTVCSDCGTIVTCHTCGAPVVLHKSKKDEKENFFLCHHCGEKRSALERCANCGGWRLTSLGIGIEKVEEALKEEFSNLSIFRIDKESAPTDKKALDLLKKFHNSQKSILLGTEMIFNYMHQPIPYTAIASMDSLFSLPDFHINERILHLLLSIQNLTEKNMLIQTREPDQKVLQKFLENHLTEFYRDELKERKALGYPPYKTIIKLTLEGTRVVIDKEWPRVEKDIKEYQPIVFPTLVGLGKGKVALNALLKIDSRNWPNENLLEKLLALPPNWTLKINPESLI
ncbi:MAG TPA: primosomal protein N' [Candidatus Paceibacterota bacterium]|nr:primosomal protein N' [Candidatus Paceibacterota bacterium]